MYDENNGKNLVILWSEQYRQASINMKSCRQMHGQVGEFEMGSDGTDMHARLTRRTKAEKVK